MPMPLEIGFEECAALLRRNVVGRVAISRPDGPHIVPITYSVVDDAVVMHTSPYSLLGTYGLGAQLVFQIDHFDNETHAGWSVVARGRGQLVTDPAQLQRTRQQWEPRPWADGTRSQHLRLRWSSLSGRRVGRTADSPVNRVVAAG